jgi:hypothetical protein
MTDGGGHALRHDHNRQSTGYERRLAEREGFEPSVRFHAHTLSKRAP